MPDDGTAAHWGVLKLREILEMEALLPSNCVMLTPFEFDGAAVCNSSQCYAVISSSSAMQ